MSDPHGLTVRLQALDGQWETLGADRYREVFPENVQFSSNDWGPDTCSFELRRNPSAIYPDLTTWTPVEIEVAGVVSWDGRVKETPVADGDDPTINVQCEGWQYHLDDDVYERKYVHTRLQEWSDVRSYPTADLSSYVTVGRVENGEGAIVLTFPNGITVPGSPGYGRHGVYLDAGEGQQFTRFVIAYTTAANTAAFELHYEANDTAPGGSTGSLITLTNNLSGLSAFTVLGRFLTIQLMNGSGTPASTGADTWVRISSIIAFTDSTYESGNASILKADTVIKHALATAAPLLSTDLSRIAAGTFSIPEFSLDGAHSPREVINAVNAYENYEIKVLLGRRLSFQPRAVAPIYEIGDWSGANFQDASANSGEEIFNRVIVQGTGPDGTPMSIYRAAPGPPWKTAPGVTVPNPGAEVNVTGWTALGSTGTITRDTTQFTTGVASFRIASGGSGAAYFYQDFGSFTSGLSPGTSYNLVFAARRVGSFTQMELDVRPGNTTSAGGSGQFQRLLTTADLPINTWTYIQLQFTQPAALVLAQIAIFITGGPTGATTDLVYFDDFRIQSGNATLVDRRGFRRTKILSIASSVTLTSGARLADLYLTAHRTVPFRGGFQVVGQGGMRRVLGGASVHPAHIQVGSMVRCANRIDPDTGAWGRDGTIASVSYSHDALTATVALDENRAGLETLLSRLAVVQGQAQT